MTKHIDAMMLFYGNTMKFISLINSKHHTSIHSYYSATIKKVIYIIYRILETTSTVSIWDLTPSPKLSNTHGG